MVVTAACCIIGDEILSGKTKDTNSHYLATVLFDLGIELKTIQVVGDEAHAIAKSVKELSSQYDIVFTSGGIGPTHDDITYESVAAAFQLKMKVDQTTYNYIQKQLTKRNPNTVMTKFHARMATFPHPATLLRELPNIKIPIVVVHDNTYILPGIPSLFQLLLNSLKPKLQAMSQSAGFHRREIATALPEVSIAGILSNFHTQDVKIGSYPMWNNDKIKVIVTVSGQDVRQVNAIADKLTDAIHGWPYISTPKSHL